MMSLKSAGISLENFFDYLVPLGVLILYFFVSGRKKVKPSPAQHHPELKPSPVRPVRRPAPAPPASRAPHQPYRSSIEERKIITSIETKDYATTIAEQSAMPSFTQQMLDLQDSDVSNPHPTLKKIPRTKELFKNRSSLRQAFLLKEILNRPYE